MRFGTQKGTLHKVLSNVIVTQLILFICISTNGSLARSFRGRPPLECRRGYFGFSCKKQCRYPKFGDRCERTCHCKQSVCDHKRGCLPDKCPDGYYGTFCETPCDSPMFGYGCQQFCACSKLQCNVTIGCQSTNKGVIPEKTTLDVLPFMKTKVSTIRSLSTVLINKTPKSVLKQLITKDLHDVVMTEIYSKRNGTTPIASFKNQRKPSSINWIRVSLVFFIVAFFGLVAIHIGLSLVRCTRRESGLMEAQINSSTP